MSTITTIFRNGAFTDVTKLRCNHAELSRFKIQISILLKSHMKIHRKERYVKMEVEDGATHSQLRSVSSCWHHQSQWEGLGEGSPSESQGTGFVQTLSLDF